MKKLLLIMEVSQKQAYIFKNKELKKNIDASYTIDEITSSGYFEKYFPEYYNKEKNLVYSGGGHTILVFDNDVEENDNTGKERIYHQNAGHAIFGHRIPIKRSLQNI